MPRPIFSIGVDLGGTWIRLEAVDAQGRSVRSFKAPAPPLSHLPTFLKQKLRAWKTKPAHLIVASRGIWMRLERIHLKRALRSLAKNVTVMSDVEAAWYMAFSRLGAGIIVIAGTGSIAYGRDTGGRSQRAGGWGPLLGDEGSAFWIGKTWLHHTRPRTSSKDILKWVRFPHETVRRVAALAPRVLHQARKKDRLARGIVQDAQKHLVELVVQTGRLLRFKKTMTLSWGGSLLNNSDFRTGFLAALRRAETGSGKRFQIIPPRGTPALTIARLFRTSS